MLGAPHPEASQTTGRARMAVVTPLQPICELAHRASNGIEIRLLWNRRSDEVRVCVINSRTGVDFELQAEHANALDVFHHPYAYAAARGISYDEAHAAATDTEQSLRLAA